MTYTLDDLKNAVIDSKSYSETLAKLGKNKTGASYRIIKKKIQEANLDTSHFVRIYPTGFLSKKHWSLVLVHDESKGYREDGARLRMALIESGREYKCEDCPNTGFWNNKEITLEVDHKDGSWQNNRPENLRFLCPNCHSQTENFYNRKKPSYCSCGNLKFKTSKSCVECGKRKNRKVKERPDKSELQKMVDDLGYCAVGRQFGVSDNAIRKWLK